MSFTSIFQNQGPFFSIEKIDRIITLKPAEVLQTDKFELKTVDPTYNLYESIVLLTNEYIYVLRALPRITNDNVYMSVRLRIHIRWMHLINPKSTDSAINRGFKIELAKNSSLLRLSTNDIRIYRNWTKSLRLLILHRDFMSKYTIEEFMDCGVTAKVYKIRNNTSGKKFACKRFKKEEMADPAFLSMVINEITVLTKLNACTEVVQLIEVHESANSVLLVTELLRGGRVTTQNTKYPFDTIYTLTHSLLKMLSILEANNIVHRDLKPGNILLKAANEGIGDTEIKIIDFGFAVDGPTVASNLACVRCGTLGYVPPEVLYPDNDQVDYRLWDIYSVGIIVYNAMTGLRLFYDPDKKVHLKLNRGNVIDFDNPDFLGYSKDCKIISSGFDKRNARD